MSIKSLACRRGADTTADVVAGPCVCIVWGCVGRTRDVSVNLSRPQHSRQPVPAFSNRRSISKLYPRPKSTRGTPHNSRCCEEGIARRGSSAVCSVRSQYCQFVRVAPNTSSRTRTESMARSARVNRIVILKAGTHRAVPLHPYVKNFGMGAVVRNGRW